MIRFDAYSATTKAMRPLDLIGLLSSVSAGPVQVVGGRGFHSFGERASVRDANGEEFGSVMWGGRQGERSMIEVKGEVTPAAVAALRERCWHRVTRVDSCADFDAPGTFDRLLGSCMSVKARHRLKGERRGDWDDFPEEGRTQYLGAPSSAVRVRLYEKGRQPEFRHLAKPDWCRLEVQARPAKDAKASFADLSPVEVWGASSWTREIAAAVLQEHIDPHPAGTVYRHSTRESALRWLCKQYGAHLVSLADDVGWECVGLTLKEMINEMPKGGKSH